MADDGGIWRYMGVRGMSTARSNARLGELSVWGEERGGEGREGKEGKGERRDLAMFGNFEHSGRSG